MKRRTQTGILALCLVLVAAWSALTACSSGGDDTTTLHVLASPELADMRPVLDDLEHDTGVRLDLDYRAANDADDLLVDGGHGYDLAWLSSDRSLRLKLKKKGGSGAAVPLSTPVMRSPVVIGVTRDLAQRLREQVPGGRLSWADIADAAATGTVRFGMVDPRHSGSGLVALVGVATAAAGTGSALRPEDVSCDRLRGFRSGQTLTADTSRELIDAFVKDGQRANALITYESELLALNKSGRLSQPLDIVYPADGTVLSDYPLLLLDDGRRAAYDRVVDWLTRESHQREIMHRTLRRPVSPSVRRTPELSAPLANALYFPDDLAVVERLVADYGDPRRPAGDRVVFLLDFSGSMRGERAAALRAAFAGLSGADSSRTGKFARFYEGERLTVVRFGGGVLGERTVTVRGPDDLRNLQAFIARDEYDGDTALWSALDHGYRTAAAALREAPRQSVSIVLMTDGENNAGLTYDQFVRRYRALEPAARRVRTYPVRLGEADAGPLRRVAAATGGRVVDADGSSLPEAFKEIRGCG
ncbi:VWA domain-containing protein [Streptomyces sp. NPDC001508]|uniref:vWA domain-containing protein n=1 Tax=Streptomyces sp. NPDC001508 TaxID=3154656 RepID=UPI00331FB192